MIYTNVPKGVAYTFLVPLNNLIDRPSGQGQWYLDHATYQISKDDGVFVTTTNTGISVLESAAFTLTLTAAEMNADKIYVVVGYSADSSGFFGSTIIIYTGSNSAGISAADVWEYENRDLTGAVDLNLNSVVTNVSSISDSNPTVREVLSLMWQAMCKTPKRAGWSFNKWINRSSL